MKRNILFLILSVLVVMSCSKDKKEQTGNVYNKGKITILTDDSFKSVTNALADAYMINYPDTDVKVSVKKEDIGFMDLLNNKANLIVMSRELSDKERKEYEKIIDLDYQPAKFAADALVFVVPKSSPLSEISLEQIKKELYSDDKNLIFDGTNSGNLNFIAQKFNTKPSELKYSIISGNKNVILELEKYPNKIGVVSLNTISRPYGKEATELKGKVKILKVTDKGKSFEPTPENLRSMNYPFTRIIYFLTNEGNFGIANGIIRFSCTQLGQLVVGKEGLQPYNFFKREVQMR